MRFYLNNHGLKLAKENGYDARNFTEGLQHQDVPDSALSSEQAGRLPATDLREEREGSADRHGAGELSVR